MPERITDQPMARTAEDFNDFVADQLRGHGDRLDQIEGQVTEVVEIIRMGRGFFRACGWVGRGVKWAAGLAASAALIWQAIEQFFRSTPPGGGS